MAPFDTERLHEVTPAEFVRIIKSMSDKEIRELMSGPDREPILAEITGRFPGFFRADRAGDLDARMNFRVEGGAAGRQDTFAVVIQGGECRIERDPVDPPTASIKVDPAEFAQLLTGQGSPMILALRGRIGVRGDLAFAQRFASYFDVPKG